MIEFKYGGEIVYNNSDSIILRNKFITKYKEQLHTPYVLHTGDLKEEHGIVYLPIYMT